MKILRHLSLAGVLLLCGCDITTTPSPTQRPIPIATLFPTAAQPAPTLPNATPAPDTGWLAGRPGVEMRRIDAQQDGKSAPLVIVRVDPAAVHLRVAYAPDAPRSLRSWFSQSNPILAINGGFFTEEYHGACAVTLQRGDSRPSIIALETCDTGRTRLRAGRLLCSRLRISSLTESRARERQ